MNTEPKGTQKGHTMDTKWTQNEHKRDTKGTQNGHKMDTKWTQYGHNMGTKWMLATGAERESSKVPFPLEPSNVPVVGTQPGGTGGGFGFGAILSSSARAFRGCLWWESPGEVRPTRQAQHAPHEALAGRALC